MEGIRQKLKKKLKKKGADQKIQFTIFQNLLINFLYLLVSKLFDKLF